MILDHPEAQALLADAILDEARLVRLVAGLGPFLERYAPASRASSSAATCVSCWTASSPP